MLSLKEITVLMSYIQLTYTPWKSSAFLALFTLRFCHKNNVEAPNQLCLLEQKHEHVCVREVKDRAFFCSKYSAGHTSTLLKDLNKAYYVISKLIKKFTDLKYVYTSCKVANFSVLIQPALKRQI